MPKKTSPDPAGIPINHGILPDLIGYQLRLAQIRVFRDFMDATAAHDISPGLLGVLLLIEANPGLKQSELAAAVHLDRSTMVGVIDRLERRGWVERRAARADRRAYQVLLTQAGGAQMREFRQLLAQHEQRIIAGLSPAEIDTLHRLLPRISAG